MSHACYLIVKVTNWSLVHSSQHYNSHSYVTLLIFITHEWHYTLSDNSLIRSRHDVSTYWHVWLYLLATTLSTKTTRMYSLSCNRLQDHNLDLFRTEVMHMPTHNLKKKNILMVHVSNPLCLSAKLVLWHSVNCLQFCQTRICMLLLRNLLIGLYMCGTSSIYTIVLMRI